MNVLHIHGTRDTVIRSSTAAPSVEGWASFQCKGATEKTDSPYASPPQNHHWGDEISKVEVRRWEGCEQNGDVELWMAPGVAHCPYSGWANAQWLLDRPKGGRSPSAGGGGDASQRKGQYDPDFLWELIVFLQTASDGLDPALTATFIQYLDSIFNAPPPPPPYRPAPAPVPSPSPSPSYGGSGSSGGFRFGGGSSMGSFLSR